MATATRTTAYTFDDFCTLVHDGQKADLIDGVIYMASPDNTDANKLSVWLNTLLYLFTQERRLGEIFILRVAFRLDDQNSPEPDIAFVRTDRLHLVRRGFVEGPPDVAIEIVSPGAESRRRDRIAKRHLFGKVGVPEYWIVDYKLRSVEVYRLDKTTLELVAKLAGSEKLASSVLPGFSCEVAAVFADLD